MLQYNVLDSKFALAKLILTVYAYCSAISLTLFFTRVIPLILILKSA